MRRTALAVLLSFALPPVAALAAPVSRIAASDERIAWGDAADEAAWIAGLRAVDPDLRHAGAEDAARAGPAGTDPRTVYDGAKRYRLFEQVGFLWTQTLDRVSLGVWNACGIASDGSTVVGLGVPSAGYAISPDGSTVVGWAPNARGIESMPWTAAAGIVVQDEPGGIAERLGAGGRSAALSAWRPPWAAVIPEPASASLGALGLVGLARRRRSA